MVRQAIVNAVTEIQEAGGSEVPQFTDELRLMSEVPRFDSLTGVEVITALSEILDADLPDDLFYDPDTLVPSSLGEIVERVLEILNELKGGRSDEHGHH